ncbi:MAG: sulfurtransferase-like selenium metabolism protein YedF [Firmicutes bacterium]|nr:sulfurtransferase-like selenium metabolism protein YedF [Bacillota bacterium]
MKHQANHQTVDCRGLACPHPVINTKKALEEPGNARVTTIVDNDVARQNIALFARNAGYTLSVEEKEGACHITITRSGGPGAPAREKKEEPVCAATVPAQERPVYLITSNALGQGSPDLGQVLMKSLFTTLVEMDPPPGALLLLNTGVFLTCEGSEVLGHVEKMHAAGTEVLSCGTCLDYYRIKDKLRIGAVSNMLVINDYLIKAPKVITIA